MGALTTAAAAKAGEIYLIGLNASRNKVMEVADGVIQTARGYNGFVNGLLDDTDKAFAAERFAEAVSLVKARIDAESPEVQATIISFFDGMGFIVKPTE